MDLIVYGTIPSGNGAPEMAHNQALNQTAIPGRFLASEHLMDFSGFL